jgi:exonuclease III
MTFGITLPSLADERSESAEYRRLRLRVPVSELGHGLFIWRIETRQLAPFQNALENPFLERLHFLTRFDRLAHYRLRNDNRAVLIGDDNVIRKDSTVAASDRLPPIDESELRDRRRRTNAAAPNREPRFPDPFHVPHLAIRDQSCGSATSHARARYVAKNSCVIDAA